MNGKGRWDLSGGNVRWLLLTAVIGLSTGPVKAVEKALARSNPIAVNRVLVAQPIGFEPLTDSDATAFVGRGMGYLVGVDASGISLSLPTQEPPKESNEVANPKLASLNMRLIGANRRADSEMSEPLEAKTNYLTGSDPRKWRRNVTSYGRLSYKDVYPGIDVEYYGRGDHIEYDFVVAPGADPEMIRLGFENAESLKLEKGGALSIGLDGVSLRQEPPVAYQVKGDHRRRIEARYVLLDKRSARIEVGAYDPELELVIDPLIKYSTPFIGDFNCSMVRDAAVDSKGNLYIVGSTYKFNDYTSYIVDSGISVAGESEALVLKISADGSKLIYAAVIGGAADDEAWGVAVDSQGYAYVVGSTEPPICPQNSFCLPGDFPTTTGAFMENYPIIDTTVDGFVLKLKQDGSGLVFSTLLGGKFNDYASDVAVDAQGAAYVTGWTNSKDFPTAAMTGGSTKPFQSSLKGAGGDADAFMTVLQPSGGKLRYSTFLGGASNDYGSGIALDKNGRVYVTGDTYSSNFPRLGAGKAVTYAGKGDAFVTVFDKTGAVVHSRPLGGKDLDQGRAIACDATGAFYVAGNTVSTDFPTKNAFDSSCDTTGTCSEDDVFVTKFKMNGVMAYSTYLGGDGRDIPFGLAVDRWGKAHVGGKTLSTDFPTTSGGSRACVTSGSSCSDCLLPDGFVTRLNASGSKTELSMYLGGTTKKDQSDHVFGLAVDATGRTYVAGLTASTGFPYTTGAYKSTLACPGIFAVALEADCNANNIGDATDIASGTSKDVNKNGIPDECDSTVLTLWPDPNNGVWVNSPDGGLSIFFPPYSVLEEVILSMMKQAEMQLPLPPPPPMSRPVGPAYFVEAFHHDGSVYPATDGPIEISIRYDPAELGAPEELLNRAVFIYVYEESAESWLPLESFVDPEACAVTAHTQRFGLFTIFISER